MKAGTTEHVKFKRLKRKLQLTHWQTIGLLEAIWQFTARSHFRGDIGKSENIDIAESIDWHGDEDELVDALVDTGWIDRHEKHRLVVHDWEHHCPKYVLGNIKKHGSLEDHPIGDSLGDSLEEDPFQEAPKPSQAKPSQAKPNQEGGGSPEEDGGNSDCLGSETTNTDDPAGIIPACWSDRKKDALGLWLQHKKEKRQSYKPTGLKSLVKKYDSWPDDRFERMVEFSIEQNYSGLFEPKSESEKPETKVFL